jgi:hypothetical protein
MMLDHPHFHGRSVPMSLRTYSDSAEYEQRMTDLARLLAKGVIALQRHTAFPQHGIVATPSENGRISAQSSRNRLDLPADPSLHGRAG